MKSKKEIFHARSKENGIVFRSNKLPALSYEAIINQSGEIETRTLPTAISDISDLGVSLKVDPKKFRKMKSLYKIIVGIVAILSILVTHKVSIAMALIYFSTTASKELIEFCQLSYSMKLGAYKSTARFHSAEHKVANAYKRKQGVPSIEEIRKASRFDKLCGSRKYIDTIVIFGVVSIGISLSGVIELYKYFAVMVMVVILSLLQKKFAIFRFLQIFVTNKPTDKELEVALAGIEFFEKSEEEIPDDCCPMGFIMMKIKFDDEEDSVEE